MDQTKNILKMYSDEIKEIENKVRNITIGRMVRIISNYNGQPYGHSKKSLQGTKFRIKHAIIDSSQTCFLGNNIGRCYIPIDEVEFVD